MLKDYFFVAIGGGVGATLRVFFIRHASIVLAGFPFGVLLANLLGCFIMGGLVSLASLKISFNHNMQNFLILGFLGGVTTFSSFALEFFSFISKNHHIPNLIFFLSSTALPLVGFYLGMHLVRIFL